VIPTIVVHAIDIDNKRKRYQYYGGVRSQCPPVPAVGEEIKGSFPDGKVTELEYRPKGTDQLTCTSLVSQLLEHVSRCPQKAIDSVHRLIKNLHDSPSKELKTSEWARLPKAEYSSAWSGTGSLRAHRLEPTDGRAIGAERFSGKVD